MGNNLPIYVKFEVHTMEKIYVVTFPLWNHVVWWTVTQFRIICVYIQGKCQLVVKHSINPIRFILTSYQTKRRHIRINNRLHNNVTVNCLGNGTDLFSVSGSLRMRWAGHVARMGEGRGVYRVLVGKQEGKRPLGKPRRRWEDNIKMDLQEVGGGCGDWMELAQDRDRSRALVSTVMNLRVW